MIYIFIIGTCFGVVAYPIECFGEQYCVAGAELPCRSDQHVEKGKQVLVCDVFPLHHHLIREELNYSKDNRWKDSHYKRWKPEPSAIDICLFVILPVFQTFLLRIVNLLGLGKLVELASFTFPHLLAEK